MSSKAIVLFSGGLDSSLAAKILQEQGIEVIGLNFVTPFHDASDAARKAAAELAIELIVHRTGDEYIRLIANPRWGYGKAVNPCLDCRVEMCRIAKKLLDERTADFVATGELAGQRPNSQMQHQLNLIARESGLDGLLVRPLSAAILPPTKAEMLGMVDRKRLFGYTGRGRGRLIALAHRYGIKHIPQPSTGCFLCETSYAPRVYDVFKHVPEAGDWDAELLNVGRQFRIRPGLKAVMGRNEDHCIRLAELFERSDAKPAVLFIPESFLGPSVLLTGADVQNEQGLEPFFQIGGSLILRYTNPAKYDPDTATVRVRYRGEERIIPAKSDPEVDLYRVI